MITGDEFSFGACYFPAGLSGSAEAEAEAANACLSCYDTTCHF